MDAISSISVSVSSKLFQHFFTMQRTDLLYLVARRFFFYAVPALLYEAKGKLTWWVGVSGPFAFSRIETMKERERRQGCYITYLIPTREQDCKMARVQFHPSWQNLSIFCSTPWPWRYDSSAKALAICSGWFLQSSDRICLSQKKGCTLPFRTLTGSWLDSTSTVWATPRRGLAGRYERELGKAPLHAFLPWTFPRKQQAECLNNQRTLVVAIDLREGHADLLRCISHLIHIRWQKYCNPWMKNHFLQSLCQQLPYRETSRASCFLWSSPSNPLAFLGLTINNFSRGCRLSFDNTSPRVDIAMLQAIHALQSGVTGRTCLHVTWPVTLLTLLTTVRLILWYPPWLEFIGAKFGSAASLD